MRALASGRLPLFLLPKLFPPVQHVSLPHSFNFCSTATFQLPYHLGDSLPCFPFLHSTFHHLHTTYFTWVYCVFLRTKVYRSNESFLPWSLYPLCIHEAPTRRKHSIHITNEWGESSQVKGCRGGRRYLVRQECSRQKWLYVQRQLLWVRVTVVILGAAANLTWLVSLKWENLDTDTHIRRTACEHESRDWGEASRSQGMPDCQ